MKKLSLLLLLVLSGCHYYWVNPVEQQIAKDFCTNKGSTLSHYAIDEDGYIGILRCGDKPTVYNRVDVLDQLIKESTAK